MTEYQEYQTNREEGFDIKKLLNKVLSRWYWFVLSVSVAYSVAWFMNRYAVPMYSASASLIINEEKKSTAELLVNVLDRYSPRKNIENEIAVIKSYSMAAKALKELDFATGYYITGRVRESILYPNSPFKVIPDSILTYGTRVEVTFLPNDQCQITIGEKACSPFRIGEKHKSSIGEFTIVRSKGVSQNDLLDKKFFFIIRNFNSLVNQYRGKVTVTPNDKRGSVLGLSSSGESAQKEADYLNTLMDVYIQNGLDEKNQTSTNAIQFIDQQLGYVTDSLKRTEDVLQSFRMSNKLLNLSQEGSAVFDRLTGLQSERFALTTQLNYYDYLKEYMGNDRNFGQVVAPSIIGIADPLLNSLVNKLVELGTQKTRLVHGGDPENNPLVKIADVQINSVLGSLRENVKQLITTANLSMKDVNDRISQVERELVKLPATERQLLNIQREYNVNNETYNFLLKKRADAAISKASNVADNKVLDYAMSQNAIQISPKRSRNIMIAVALGILIPLALIFIIDFFNQIINDLQEIKTVTDVPVVGMIGHNDKDSEVPVAENPASPLSESFRALRTNLHYILRDKSNKVINVTSTVSGEGKTFISINLATIIAHSGKKALLMGLDLRKPKINQIFNIDNHDGISTYLIGDSKYEDIIHSTNISNLYIAPSGPVPPNPAELIDTPEMKQLVEKVSDEFDFIVIDTPPVAVVVDSLLLAQFSDVNIFVVRQNYSSKDSLLLANDLHQRPEIKGLGLVVNDIHRGSSYGLGKYRYSYNYGYGYNYSGYGNYYSGYMEEDKPSQGFWKRLFSKK
ncbi:MAG: polysaccharide biosynthesis tyrosine autokinase [Bacteroidales bacterium]|jgi:capsular exopolysaccharide synthesis family protein|nr:polysaccharide biosynthesis tyrosine autokinase [Bacteroidales bacterium]